MFTLRSLTNNYPHVPILICDDASTDGTVAFVRANYPQIECIQNTTNKGLIYNRNLLLRRVKTSIAISLDDDAHFITLKCLDKISNYFENNNACAVLSFRLFWGLVEPRSTASTRKAHQVDSFLGGAHAFRMKAWYDIPEYPAWYTFYGEEQFASLQLFKKKWEVHYFPEVLVHHRVDNKARKQHKGYITRTRRALHASWSNIILFFPLHSISRKLIYSIYAQLRFKVLKGDLRAGVGILAAMGQIIINLPKLIRLRDALTQSQYETFSKLAEVEIYWDPKNE